MCSYSHGSNLDKELFFVLCLNSRCGNILIHALFSTSCTTSMSLSLLKTKAKLDSSRASYMQEVQSAPTSNSHTNSLETVKLCRHSCLGLPHTNTFQSSYLGNCSQLLTELKVFAIFIQYVITCTRNQLTSFNWSVVRFPSALSTKDLVRYFHVTKNRKSDPYP